MKKIISSTLVVTLGTILFSCQKQKDLTLPSSGTAATQTTPNKLVPMPPVRIPFILSDWFSVNLNPDKDGGLYGRYELRKPFPGTTDDTDVKLAYVRRNVQGTGSAIDGVSYSQLPVIFNTSDGYLAEMSFALGTSFFELFVNPIGIIPVFLDPNDFRDCTYRYLIISKLDYDGLKIDWSDYKSVAYILNFTP